MRTSEHRRSRVLATSRCSKCTFDGIIAQLQVTLDTIASLRYNLMDRILHSSRTLWMSNPNPIPTITLTTFNEVSNQRTRGGQINTTNQHNTTRSKHGFDHHICFGASQAATTCCVWDALGCVEMRWGVFGMRWGVLRCGGYWVIWSRYIHWTQPTLHLIQQLMELKRGHKLIPSGIELLRGFLERSLDIAHGGMLS